MKAFKLPQAPPNLFLSLIVLRVATLMLYTVQYMGFVLTKMFMHYLTSDLRIGNTILLFLMKLL